MMKEFGYIDGISGSKLEGWAQNCANDMSCALVEISIDGDYVGAVSANAYRDDLARRSISGGFAGFSYNIPAKYFDGAQHRIDCRIAQGQTALADSPTFFTRKFDAMSGGLALQRQVFTKDIDRSEFKAVLAATRKLAIISTHHNLKNFLKYQTTIVRSLRRSGFVCLVVHSCDVFSSEMQSPDESAFLVAKRNTGYDFGAYALGVNIARDYMSEVDEIVLTNDSVFHMVDDISQLIARARDLKVDLVGATDSFERRYHLQSYFLWAGKNLVASSVLTAFLMSFPSDANRAVAVEEGELALTQYVLNEGMKAEAIGGYEAVAAAWMRRRDQNWNLLRRLTERHNADTSSVLEQFENTVDLVRTGVPVNPTHFFWDTLLREFDIPLLKREFVISNPCKVSTYLNLPMVLEEHPRVKSEIKELVRRYGGERILALSDSDAERPLRQDKINPVESHLPKSVIMAQPRSSVTRL